MSLASEYPRILRDYVALAVRYAKPGMDVLKTDCFNEAKGKPDERGIAGHLLPHCRLTMVEIDQATIDQAASHGFKADHGDIRKLPYADGAYDLVLDFSTIDHVKDYKAVLREYARVLRPGGRLVVVYWSAPTERYDRGQFYFEFGEFARAFEAIFQGEKGGVLYTENGVQGMRALLYSTGVRK